MDSQSQPNSSDRHSYHINIADKAKEFGGLIQSLAARKRATSATDSFMNISRGTLVALYGFIT
jgi:hypothetical protein